MDKTQLSPRSLKDFESRYLVLKEFDNREVFNAKKKIMIEENEFNIKKKKLVMNKAIQKYTEQSLSAFSKQVRYDKVLMPFTQSEIFVRLMKLKENLI